MKESNLLYLRTANWFIEIGKLHGERILLLFNFLVLPDAFDAFIPWSKLYLNHCELMRLVGRKSIMIIFLNDVFVASP